MFIVSMASSCQQNTGIGYMTAFQDGRLRDEFLYGSLLARENFSDQVFSYKPKVAGPDA
jgi:hypothetical protein